VAENAQARRIEQRRNAILEVARERAEAGGWPSVTTRTLAQAIGYSQPVLYGHFPGGKSEIMSAIAMIGFGELTAATRAAGEGLQGGEATYAVAEAYLRFAAENPVVYSAMFALPISATFAHADSDPILKEAFEIIVSVTGDPTDDAPTTAEVLWSALHGLSVLEQARRMRPEQRTARLRSLAAHFGGS
jgi:AcrR family transcriptional regulator